MKELLCFKIDNQDTQAEYSVDFLVNTEHNNKRTIIEENLLDIDNCIHNVQDIINEYNADIDKLTNQADIIDNLLAVSSGVLCGFIDSFFVGEFNFEQLKADSNKHINQFIEKYAKMNGYDGKGRLKGAIEFLEKKFPVDQDNIWKLRGISSTKLHHLEDLAHHPTPFGLLAAIIVSFLRVGIFVDKNGKWHFQAIDANPKQILKTWLPIIISGVILWLVHLAKSKHPEKLDNLPKPIKKIVVALAASPAVIEVLLIAHNWFGHLVSDMGGSKNTAGGGMGIPGLFLSLLKELASIPPLNMTPLSEVVSDFYSKDKFDMRTELAIVEHLGKQAIPVILNEAIVRTFYFVRRLITEKQKCEKWADVNWKNVIPINNRTINRMLTIASGTFMAVDMADAAIRSGMKSGGEPVVFAANFILHINFVGIGRFAIAVWIDSSAGLKKQKKERERQLLYQQQIELYNAKMFYKNADMWISAENASKAVQETTAIAQQSISYFTNSWEAISTDLSSVSNDKENIEKNNPDLIDTIKDLLN
jgi:hypothetical protein